MLSRPSPQGPADPRHDLLRVLLERAGKVALDRFREPEVRVKSDGSVVTDADLVANAVLIDGLTRAFPDDALISEESEQAAAGNAAGTWYIDPIDGTSAFTEGLAHWGPTVARRDALGWDVGAFWLPRLGEWWFASRDGGAWRDGVRLSARSPEVSHRRRSLYLPSGAHHLGSLHWRGKGRSLGSTAAHLALVAGGGAAATIVPSWSPWDVGCGLLLLQETANAVTDLDGASIDPMDHLDLPFLAGAPGVLPDLASALRGALDSSAWT